MAIAAEHPLALAAGATQSGAAGLHRRMPPRQHDGSRHRHAGKEGHAHRLLRAASVHRQAGGSVGGQLRADGLRRRRRHGRAGARRARLRVRAQEQAADRAGGEVEDRRLRERRSAVAGRVHRTRHHDELGRVRRPRIPAGGRRDRRGAREEGPRAQAHAMAPARLGHLAPALLGLPGAAHPLREVRRRAGARRPAARGAARRPGAGRLAAIRSTRRRRSTNASARRAAPTRAARRTRWTPSWIRRGISCASPARMRTPWSTSAPTTGCRWTSTSAASSTPSCTCCTRASGPRSCATWGSSRSTSRSRTC